MIREAKKNIDLTSVVENSGVELRRSGTRHIGLCPFHSEKTPSFIVFPDNHFKCFGCGEHGDCIDFVQKHYGLSFPEALKHLGIETGELSDEAKEQMERRKRERREAEGFKRWQQNAFDEFHLLISSTKKIIQTIKTPSDLDRAGSLFHSLTFWEHCLDVLINGDHKQKTRLYLDSVVTGEYREPRLWIDSFNYRGWLKEFQKRDADEWEISLHFAGRETDRAKALNAG
jgi:hypothetical protein